MKKAKWYFILLLLYVFLCTFLLQTPNPIPLELFQKLAATVSLLTVTSYMDCRALQQRYSSSATSSQLTKKYVTDHAYHFVETFLFCLSLRTKV